MLCSELNSVLVRTKKLRFVQNPIFTESWNFSTCHVLRNWLLLWIVLIYVTIAQNGLGLCQNYVTLHTFDHLLSYVLLSAFPSLNLISSHYPSNFYHQYEPKEKQPCGQPQSISTFAQIIGLQTFSRWLYHFIYETRQRQCRMLCLSVINDGTYLSL